MVRRGFDVPPPSGGGGMSEAGGPKLFPSVNVEPSRSSRGGRRRSNHGEEFPDGNDRYGQVFQWRTRLRLHQARQEGQGSEGRESRRHRLTTPPRLRATSGR